MFDIVTNFEKEIAEFYNAPFAVATDSCTHAIELCLRYKNVKTCFCPNNTYVSIPMTFEKLNLDWSFTQQEWHDFYYIGNTNIIDAAVYWNKDGYIVDSLMCLSFQFKKQLGLGRGGIILCSDELEYIELKKMSYDGREFSKVPWADQDISSIGYHYYMTPETAQLGSDKLARAIASESTNWSWEDYPDLSTLAVFNT